MQKLIDLNVINNLVDMKAHLKDDRCENLEEHIKLCYKYFEKIQQDKNFHEIKKRLLSLFSKDFSEPVQNLFEEMFDNTIFCHDFGKMNPNFQYGKMKNNKFKRINGDDSNHSMLSSIVYFNEFFKRIEELKLDEEVRDILMFFLFMNSYIISKHHGELQNFDGFIEIFKGKLLDCGDIKGRNLLENYTDILSFKKYSFDDLNDDFDYSNKRRMKNDGFDQINYFIYSKILFSLLVASDFYSTYDFMNSTIVNNFGNIKNIDLLQSAFIANDKYKNIEKYKKIRTHSNFEFRDINDLRCEMFLEAEENFLKNIDNNIFYLEAPTGSGKTFTSMNLALLAIKECTCDKIFYIFPFNTLIEQTKTSLIDCFKDFKDGNSKIDDLIAEINSITPIKYADPNEDNKIVLKDLITKDGELPYDKLLLDRQFMHYEIILTSHVNFFSILFGNEREHSFPLVHLINSVIIIDEIQSYRNEIWIEIIEFLKKYAHILNIKIIIMSATLPNFDLLYNGELKASVSLIKNRDKYFKSKFFKDRVKLDYSLLEYGNDYETIASKIIEKILDHRSNNILIEFLTKKSADSFYDLLKDDMSMKNFKLLKMTGDDNKYERKKIIETIKNDTSKNIILVATSVIEAGVDIDMDIGFKNISILDGEEQFIGRINRNFKRNGLVYFFKIDKNVIKNDIRTIGDYSIENLEIRKLFEQKDFNSYYEDHVLLRLIHSKNKLNSGGLQNSIYSYLKDSNFREIYDHMKLIEDKLEYTVFLNREISTEEYGILSGYEVFNDYIALLQNNEIDYATKMCELSVIKSKMDYFTYNVSKPSFPYNKVVGNIFYIEDGDMYFDNGKFNRNKFDDSNII